MCVCVCWKGQRTFSWLTLQNNKFDLDRMFLFSFHALSSFSFLFTLFKIYLYIPFAHTFFYCHLQQRTGKERSNSLLLVVEPTRQSSSSFFFFPSAHNNIDESNHQWRREKQATMTWQLPQTIPKRYILSLLAFFGFFNAYVLRSNLSIAIITMVRSRFDSTKNSSSIVMKRQEKQIFNRTFMFSRV